MRSLLNLRPVVALALFAGLPIFSHAAVQNRITSSVQESSRVALVHTVAPKAASATDLGAAPSSLKLEGMTLHFSMTDAQQAALSQLLLDQQNSSSPRFHQWLTPQQFGAQFGLSADDLSKVSSWLTSQGFTITATANSSTFITFSGTVAQVQQAFGTSIHNVSLDGEQHISNLTEPTLPSAIAGVVGNIAGLNDFKLKSRTHVRKVEMNALNDGGVHPKDSITTTAGLEHFISPGDFYTIYDENPLINSSINGTGISIAVMGQVDISQTDIAAFRTASGLSANVPTIKTYGTDPGTPTGTCLNANPPSTCTVTGDDLDESELDVEWAGATAPSAKIIFVNSTDVIGISLLSAIDDDLAPIMTISYGGCEITNFSASSINAYNQFFQQANAEGITIVGPAGDAGATDCDSGVVSATHGLAVDFPASSPNVTGVGGTEFTEGADTAGKYWNNTTTSVSSALSYIPETVWNDTAADIAAATASNPASLSAGGGGASKIFPKPSWQTGTGVPADGQRDVPDLSFNASADHDAYLVCAQNSCQGGTYFVQSGTNTGSFNAFGGTSVSTPSFAGILAVVEQKLGGSRLGNANPYIYALANGGSYSSIFHDVTTGNNSSPCTVGTTGCTSSPIGFSAGVGYDQATGWGSIDVNQFATTFSSVATNLPGTTTIAVIASSANPAIGANVTFTATVAHTGTANPTGTVVFIADGATSSPTVTLSSTGTASYTTAFPGCGTHSVYAYYTSGDTNYYGASSGIAIPVGSSSCTMTVAANPASTTIASNGTFSSTITVTSVGGFVGSVDLSASSSTLGGSYTFTPTSVTLTSGGSQTTTFSINSVTAALKSSGQLKRSGGTSSLAVGGGATLAGLLLFGLTGIRRRRLSTLLGLLVVFAGIAATSGCSSSSTTGGGTTTTTTSGTGTITITATDATTGTVTGSTTITVTIQ